MQQENISSVQTSWTFHDQDVTHTTHDLGHDGVFEVGKRHSDIGVMLLGQEQVPQTQRSGLLLEVLDHLRVCRTSQEASEQAGWTTELPRSRRSG